MNSNDAKKIVRQAIISAMTENGNDTENLITDETQLIGGESLLDSMKLVEVCLALEDAAEDAGFQFDWTSETAMSKSRSMFRTVGSLAEEFATQSKQQVEG